MFTGKGLLTFLFKQADKAGFGYANGASFEAIPGLEDAAADFIEGLLADLGGAVGAAPADGVDSHCCSALDGLERERAAVLGIFCGEGRCARRLLWGECR